MNRNGEVGCTAESYKAGFWSNKKDACNKIGVPFIELDIIPFTATLPEFNRSRHSIIYGVNHI